MNMERDAERQERLEPLRREAAELRKRKEELEEIRRQLFALFSESNPQKRGKAVEAVLNRYFRFSGILISEAIALKGDPGTGIVEQIDGVIQLRGQLYLIEMKWEKETLGRDKVASHLVRVFNRSLAGGIIISYSDYSDAAVGDCREALREKVIVLCKLEELVRAIERGSNLSTILDAKIDAAVIQKNPLFLPTI
jgi:restriction system protein